MLAYPTEGEKGRYIGIFWAIFNLGSVVGSSVSLGAKFPLQGAHLIHFHATQTDYNSSLIRRIQVRSKITTLCCLLITLRTDLVGNGTYVRLRSISQKCRPCFNLFSDRVSCTHPHRCDDPLVYGRAN